MKKETEAENLVEAILIPLNQYNHWPQEPPHEQLHRLSASHVSRIPMSEEIQLPRL